MTDKELRQLKRSDLIEILYYMRQEIDELREENAKLEARVDVLIGEAVGKRKELSDNSKEVISKESADKKRKKR